MVETITKVGEGYVWQRANCPPGMKHPDGLYSTGEGERLFVEGGVLFLPMELLGEDVKFGPVTRLVLVKSRCGERMMFVRARDFLSVRPEFAAGVESLARVYGCGL